MFGSDARAETDSILRHRWIIHRRDPKTAPPQLVAEPIHAPPITDDNGHHVSCGCSGIEPELVQLGIEVIGVFPKFRAQLRVAYGKFQCFQNRRNHYRR